MADTRHKEQGWEEPYRGRKKVIGVLVVVAVLVVGYLAASPYVVLHRIKNAVDSKDDIAIAEFIDFPALRESVKSQMLEVFTRDVSKKDDFAFLGPALVEGLLSPMVHGVVSQAGLSRLLDEGGKVGGFLDNASASYVSWSTFVITIQHN